MSNFNGYSAKAVIERAKLISIAKYGRRVEEDLVEYTGSFGLEDLAEWLEELPHEKDKGYIEAYDDGLRAVWQKEVRYTEEDREEAEELLRIKYPESYSDLQEWKTTEFAVEYNKFKKALDESS